jgi:hypothetical protein
LNQNGHRLPEEVALTRNDATQVSVEMADTLSVVESISGKQGWLLEAIKTTVG